MIDCSNLNLEKQGQSDPPLLGHNRHTSSHNVSNISLTDEGDYVKISRKASHEGYPTEQIPPSMPQSHVKLVPEYAHNNSNYDTLQV